MPFDGIKHDLWKGGVRVPTIAARPGQIPATHVVQTPRGSQGKRRQRKIGDTM
ncbi:MAG: hypothetical protein WKF89_14985 [Chitinophagaceae bacterium]